MAGNRSPIFELAGVEHRLIAAGQFHPVRAFLGWFRLSVPREKNPTRVTRLRPLDVPS
jgi:hypothetical protein